MSGITAGRARADAPVKAPPWDPAPTWGPHGLLHRLELDGRAVADYVDGAGAPVFDARRPHLHPVRTPGGVVVTDAAARDHTWHLGISLGVQDVAGNNLWGGRTYVRDDGYTWRRDHGSIRHEAWVEHAPGVLVDTLSWLAADGSTLLTETRDLRWTWAPAPIPGWILELTSTLEVACSAPVSLGSPGSNGRPGGGYGGLFWRLPPCSGVDVRTPVARGEESVHGTVSAEGASWLAWSALATPAGVADDETPHERPFTVAIAPLDDVTARDPWFVRVADYPGFGSALAWTTPAVVRPGGPVRRAFRCLVADGLLEDAVVGSALGIEQDLFDRRDSPPVVEDGAA